MLLLDELCYVLPQHERRRVVAAFCAVKAIHPKWLPVEELYTRINAALCTDPEGRLLGEYGDNITPEQWACIARVQDDCTRRRIDRNNEIEEWVCEAFKGCTCPEDSLILQRATKRMFPNGY